MGCSVRALCSTNFMLHMGMLVVCLNGTTERRPKPVRVGGRGLCCSRSNCSVPKPLRAHGGDQVPATTKELQETPPTKAHSHHMAWEGVGYVFEVGLCTVADGLWHPHTIRQPSKRSCPEHMKATRHTVNATLQSVLPLSM